VQFDTTINRWHTLHATGRINGSNPCFTGDSLVHTDKGLIRFDALLQRAQMGETFGVYTHDATNPEAPAERLEITSPEALMITGLNEIVRLEFDNGMEVRCTANHKVFTVNRGFVPASELTAKDEVKVLDLPAPAVNAERRFPVSTDVAHYRRKADQAMVDLPEKWSPEFAHYLGWLIGDGCISSTNVVSTIYGSPDDREHVLPRHLELLTEMCQGAPPKPSVQANGTVQLRLGRGLAVRFLEALGVGHTKAPEKTVPWSIQEAPADILAAFLRGLFDADGCVYDGKTTRYVGLGSASRALLQGVQRLLTTFGISSRIYATRNGGGEEFVHFRKDGTFVIYEGHQMYDLRISGENIARFSDQIGFTLQAKADKLVGLLDGHVFHRCRRTARLVQRSDDGVELTYNLCEPRNHSYIVNGCIVMNCSEYLSVDNSACNLASLNLLRYLEEGGTFDVEGFKASVEVLFTAQEILVGMSDYPTEKIGQNAKRFRQLGIGYANLGALLMSQGMAYDSDDGRAYAAAITALMTGQAYATSARTAARMGPFAGYTENAEHMLRVLRMHRDEVAKVDEEQVPTELLSAAQEVWDHAVEEAERFGVRNSQASVLAPTGCLVAGTLVPTERGLVRLRSLGDTSMDAEKWQDLGIKVQTDDGARTATQFYVNGLEPVVRVQTKRGYSLQGTTQHRVKVVDANTGEFAWRRLADMGQGDLVPMALDQLVGGPQTVTLPPLPEAHWTGEHHSIGPRVMTAQLAELVGYFMGDGSLHARGVRFCVANGDFDVVERLLQLGKEVFNLVGHVTEKHGYTEVRLDSVRLVLWWEACGLAKREPSEGHAGKGYVAHVPDAVLHSNDRAVYGAFLRGLFEADGTVTMGYPHWMTTSLDLAGDVQTLLLALGFPTTRTLETKRTGWGQLSLSKLRLLNLSYNDRWLGDVGFIGARKNAKVTRGADLRQSARGDHIPLPRPLIDRLAPEDDRLRKVLLMECNRGTVSRRIATELYERTSDAELGHLLSFFYDRVASAELGDEELTYDLSVPDNVTYLANGFVSHNTISFLLDCDTTGVEPDLGLVKMKKLVGGGTMSIVNHTVPRALRKLGYADDEVAAIVSYIDEHKTIMGAPALKAEHLPVFACSMGENYIHYLGHVRMMAAVQPFISGALSKTVNVPEEATVEDIEQLYLDSWQMGIKALAVYRDNCKVAQPLSTVKKGTAGDDTPSSEAEAHDMELAVKVAELEKALDRQTVVVKQPIRERLPRRRRSATFAFRVADCEGYVTVGEYDDGRPGEVFVKVSKQGSTLAGVMDAFSISISLGLQHGVPLKTYVQKYTNMRFEPAGITDDPDLRIAASLMDYIFRRLAVDYLPVEERAELGILTTEERTQPTLPGVDEVTTPSVGLADPPPESAQEQQAAQAAGKDAPFCYPCGVEMQRAGSCYACGSCGTTSGCS
ncbi:MAG: ribonucleoside-diphosphate reductase, partial [Actinomycetota bacterium]|nr:ribonucleoside-diphosphate reductase [Actinomycetota bacterium]